MNKNKAFCLFVIAVIVLRTILNFLFSLLSGAPYVFVPVNDLLIPMSIAITLGYLFFLRGK